MKTKAPKRKRPEGAEVRAARKRLRAVVLKRYTKPLEPVFSLSEWDVYK